MFKKEPIPVYLFTGFLDSGKTSFIRQAIDEGQFRDGLTTLLIVCEEGEEDIDIMRLDANKFIVRKVEDEDQISEVLFRGFDKDLRPARVMIESNGMWDATELFEAFPPHWQLAEVVTTVDATTFEMYLGNMKMMMTNQFLYSDLVIFNRCEESQDRAMFKRMVRAVNRRAQVLYETPEGKVEDNVPEEMPYDMNAPIIEIADEDFGIFYIDILDNLPNYIDKVISLRTMAYHPKNFKKDMFVVGRMAMTCCAEDIQFVGLPCEYADNNKYKDKQWIRVTAKVSTQISPEDGGPIPYLIATGVESTGAAEDEIVYFN